MQADPPPPSGAPGHAPSPSPRSPTKARRLSPAIIIAATGQEALEDLEELEMIFGAVSEIGGLERCTSLRSLTLIDCGLRRISNLEPVRHSLVKMCLCDQGLKKMEGLCLPGLRELYLHQNKISKIEGLDGCPSLRRLWLFSNRITVMEGLHHCGALRELWLHDNRITAAAGMQSLVHLQNLGLAGNPIVGVRHLSGLRGLPSLMELTLDDIHFGTCPVVAKAGYRSFVLRCLSQVRRLDGLEVMEADRADVEHKYEQEALAYQERLEDIERRKLAEIQQAEMARHGGVERGSEAKAEMMRALKALEGLVKEGRAAISREQSRQEKVQAANLLELESNLLELQRQYCKEVDKRVQVEEAKAKEEDRLFWALEKRTRLERDYAQLVAQQQSRVVQGVAIQELSDHSPDFQRLRMEVLENQRTQSGRMELMNVLRACRLYNRRLCEGFLASGGKSSPTVRLYISVSGREDMEAICSDGLSALGRPAVVLFPDPRQAAAAAAATAAAATAAAATAAAAAAAAAAISTTSSSSSASSTATTTASAATPITTADASGAVILQLAVILPPDQAQIDTNAQERPPRRGGGGGAAGSGARGPNRRIGVQKGAAAGGGGGGGGASLARVGGATVPAELVERVEASGRVTRVVGQAPAGGGAGRESSPTSSSTPERNAFADAGGEAEDSGGAAKGASYFIFPERCFPLALPEFHVLCASGAVGEDKRSLDGALSKLGADNLLGPAPAADLLLQVENKMEEQVKAYLKRMQEDVTPAEASRLQATHGNLRWKAANVASLRADADEQRALQEAILRHETQEEQENKEDGGGGTVTRAQQAQVSLPSRT